MRDSIILYRSLREATKQLDLETRAKVYDAVMDYAFDGVEPEETGVIQAMFLMMKPIIDANNQRYENGCKGGRPKNQNKTEIKPNQNQTETKVEPNKDKDKDVDKEEKEMVKEKATRFGELGYVRLTDEQYTTLKQKYPDLDGAIEVLDTWLGTTGSKHRNKNHYAYFKQNSWVWERLAENHPKESQKIEYSLPKETTKEEIHKMVEARKQEDEEAKQRAAEAQRRSDFIKSKGYASVVSLISAGKDVYDRVMAEYRQANGF